MTSEGKISFLKNYSFDSEEISDISNGFGACLLDEMIEDLSANKFSLSIALQP